MNTTSRRCLALLGALLFLVQSAAAAVGRTPGAATVTVDGVAAYSVPLSLPAGTAGLTPTLSLEYRHDRRGGLLGAGFGIGGLSQISRCPRTLAQDGAAAPVHNSAADRFCLDGRRLVVVNGLAYGAPGSEYRTEVESHARIRAHGVAGAGPQSFVVESADGRILEYGATADSRIDAGGRLVSGSATPRTWALSRIRDRDGNAIDFRYEEDAIDRGYRLHAVGYNGNPSRGLPAAHVVQFSYATRPANDVDHAFVAGTPVRQVTRLTQVEVLHEGAVVRRYELEYEPSLSSAGRSRLASLRECGAGGADCLAPTTLRWQDGTPGLAHESALPLPLPPQAAYNEQPFWLGADLNGDGRADLVWSAGATGAATLRYRLGSDTGLGPEVVTAIAAATPGVPFDYNADGRSDLLLLSAASRWMIVPGTATGLGTPLDTGLSATGVVDYRGLDLDGDGRGDIAWSEIVGTGPPTLYVRARYALPGGGFSAPVTLYDQSMSTGYDWPEGGDFLGRPGQRIDRDGDGREELLLNEQYSLAHIGATEASSSSFGSSFFGGVPLDFNGDGCTDFAYLRYTGRWRVWFGTCGSGATAVPELEGPAWSGNPRPVVIDWNGDGRDDLLLRGATHWQVLVSAGDRMLPIVDTGIPHGGAASAFAADVDGDGLDDLLARVTGQLRLRLHLGVTADLLLEARDGFGVTATFGYAPLTRAGVHTRFTGAAYPQRDLQDARPVATSLVLDAGGGSRVSAGFAYEGLRQDLQGRGGLGFARRIAIETAGSVTLRREETFRQDFPFTGLPAARALRQASRRAIQEHSWQYAQVTLGSGAASRSWPYLAAAQDRRYEAGGAFDGALLSTHAYATQQVDAAAGLVLDANWTTTEHGTGQAAGASRTRRLLHGSVLTDTTHWCLGRPLSTQLTESHTLPGGTAQTRTIAQTWDSLHCRPTQQQLEPGDSQWQVTTTFGYDAFGNLSLLGLTGAGLPTRTTQVHWDPRGRFPVAITDPLWQVSQLAWDAAPGLPVAATDANGLVTRHDYDSHGRLVATTRPDGTRRVLSRLPCGGATDCGGPGGRYLLRQVEQSAAGATQGVVEQAHDALDRWLLRRELQANGGLAVQTRSFDARGRLSHLDLPRWAGASAAASLSHSWDLLDRPTGTLLRDASGTPLRWASYEYRGLTSIERDSAGRATALVRTAWGDVASVTDPAGGESRYRHDAAGRLLQAVDAHGNVVSSVAYNVRGMKVAQADMDLGAWTFTPNALGELVALRDAKGQVTSYAYDLLSRPLRRSEPAGVTTWTWGHSSGNTATSRVAGRLLQVAGPGYGESYGYDALGRPQRRTIVADASYEYAFAYDAAGRLASLTYPASTGGYRLRLGYEYAHGHPVRIRDLGSAATLWQLNAVDPAGRVLDEVRGANLRVITGVNPATGDIDYLQAGINGGATVQNLAYRRDGHGNLVERSDLNRGVTERFTYDSLDRLDEVRRNGALTLDLDYDLIGNITSRSDVGAFSYHPTRRHAVVVAGARQFAYDANGNMTSRNGAGIAWTSFNQPASIGGANGASSSFAYGPDRQRWRQVVATGGGTETTVYVGGLVEKVTRGGVTDWKHYVVAPTGPVALHLRSTDGSVPRTLLLTQDALGSTDQVLEPGGASVLATSFDAPGARRAAGWSGPPAAADLAAAGRSTRDGFTGHEQLDHLGLVHMNGRVYDPLIGRFLSPDPVIQAPFHGQDLNRYAYAWNNPLRFTDPSGYNETVPCRSFDDACAQVVVTGLREFPRSLDHLSSLQLAWLRAGYNGQVASAWERDPCGQDGSAEACRGGPWGQSHEREAAPVVVLSVAALDYVHGFAAQLANIGMNSSPVAWLLTGGASFEWFQVPDTVRGRAGATLGEAGIALGGVAGIARAAMIRSTAGVLRTFEQNTDQIYYRVYSGDATAGKWLTSRPPSSSRAAQESLSLPPWNKATHVQEVLVPAGTLMRRSRASAVPEWARYRGGAEQYELLEAIPPANFGAGRPLP